MRTHRSWITLAALALSTMTAAAQGGSPRLAVVNGEVLTEEQVNTAAARDLADLDMKRLQAEAKYKQDKHEILEKTLDGLIQNRLLQAEAAKRKISLEELAETEIEKNVKSPTDAEVETVYEQNKARIPLPREQALPQVRGYLVDMQRNEIREAFISKLKKEYGVTAYLEPNRNQIPSAGFPSRGPAAAPVTIVEFSDFECPYCSGLLPTLKQVEKAYGDKVRIVYRQFPLTAIHPHAQKAAEASLCANEQQHFWEFHDSLFSNQRDLTVEALKRRAEEMKLDAAAFNACLDSGKQADAITKDIDEGARAGVTGTPALFINGRLLSGNQPYASIADVIEDELQRNKSGK
ncbi:MAG: hypothetical protein DMG13_13150 [Acidobacteria bacterium]|nr:MAG: hypothetical protein DMG13_13150 [Acidobacteriota bacterium]